MSLVLLVRLSLTLLPLLLVNHGCRRAARIQSAVETITLCAGAGKQERGLLTTNLLAGSTSTDTSETRTVLARGSTILLVTSGGTTVTAAVLAVTALTVTTGSAVSTLTATNGGTSGASRALVGSGDNLGREVEVLAEVLNTLVGEGVEVPLPRELGMDITTRGERLESLDNLKVGDLELRVLNVEVLGGDHNTLLEERGVDVLAVLLADDHFGRFTTSNKWERWWSEGGRVSLCC